MSAREPSRLFLVPFVGEGVGAPERIDGEALVKEATTIAARGEGVFISAMNVQEAHRRARAILEARTLLRQIRENSDAYRDGYAAALRELGAFLSLEVERWETEGATEIAEEVRAARHRVIESVCSWAAARTAKGEG